VGFLMKNNLVIEKFFESLFGYIIIRRPQSSGTDDQISHFKTQLQCRFDGLYLIRSCQNLFHWDTDFLQLVSHKIRVGINRISGQDFIADDDEYCLHAIFFFLWKGTSLHVNSKQNSLKNYIIQVTESYNEKKVSCCIFVKTTLK